MANIRDFPSALREKTSQHKPRRQWRGAWWAMCGENCDGDDLTTCWHTACLPCVPFGYDNTYCILYLFNLHCNFSDHPLITMLESSTSFLLNDDGRRIYVHHRDMVHRATGQSRMAFIVIFTMLMFVVPWVVRAGELASRPIRRISLECTPL